jgi:FAD:protein FMN transferase
MSVTLLGIAYDVALGTSVRVVVTRPEKLTEAKNAVDDVLRAMDVAASRFRPDSELSKLNESPDRDVTVSRLLAQALAAGLRGARLTEGAVDPTVGSAIKLAGYDRDFADVALDGAPFNLTVRAVPGWQAVQLHEASRTVRVSRGVEIDLGATAKALAADLGAAAAFRAIGSGGVLVSLGGDIAVAGEPPEEGWLIQAGEDSAAAIDDGEETISIRSGAIATSSTTVRRWRRGGDLIHHIIDPSTSLPSAGPWRTATVIAAKCVDANIAATGALVMGDAAVAWLEENRLPARLVDNRGIVLRLAGWPERPI